MIELILTGLTWKICLAYIDDVIVLGKDFEDHLVNLRTVLERFRENNLKLKPQKCKFFQKEVIFLGKLVNEKGIAVNPSSREVILNWPVPLTKKAVESFLGFTNYHREHIKRFATLAEPLYALTKKKVIFQWEKQHQIAFESLQQALVNSVTLAYPDPKEKAGKLHTNADGLSRRPDDLDSCNCYYAGADIKLLPCGGCSYCTRAQKVWSSFEDDVDYVVPLSVRSVSEQEEDLDETNLDSLVNCNWISESEITNMGAEQRKDQELNRLIVWLEDKKEPEEHELYLCSPSIKHLWNCKHQLVLKDGILCYKWLDPVHSRLLLVVPRSLRHKILENCHDAKLSGHFGQAKTIERLKQNYIWYGLREDARNYVKSCHTCNVNKKANVKPKGPLGQFHAGIPMEKLHMDILGPLHESSSANKYVLVLEAHKFAREKLQAAQLRQKRTYDIKLYHKTYEVGDIVFKLDSTSKVGQSKKLRAPWQGPYVVIRVLSPVLYEITGRKKEMVIHHDRIKQCDDEIVPLWIKRLRNRLFGQCVPEGNMDSRKEENELPDGWSDVLFSLPYSNCDSSAVQLNRNDESSGNSDSSAVLLSPDKNTLKVPDKTEISDRVKRKRFLPSYLSDYVVDVVSEEF
ncbi:unnamed protein product [Mytilus edulis]|uniref:Reverse transcriptase domain-containing protein n=1 Tax=Mytilus edulis TaxID=6550 RepID=A0A8S3T237_MYTED|nr:unnamed protein product [Mytilus edulis]